jgi:ketosteroid isomerase-like protein
MPSEPLEIVQQVGERWNAGDIDGMLDLFHDDVVMTPSPHWLETVQLKGKDAFRRNTEEWLGAWDSIEMETEQVEAFGNRVLAHGCWVSTGRVSGLDGRMPIQMVFTVRDGRIARLEWFEDHASAVAAARGA